MGKNAIYWPFTGNNIQTNKKNNNKLINFATEVESLFSEIVLLTVSLCVLIGWETTSSLLEFLEI